MIETTPNPTFYAHLQQKPPNWGSPQKNLLQSVRVPFMSNMNGSQGMRLIRGNAKVTDGKVSREQEKEVQNRIEERV